MYDLVHFSLCILLIVDTVAVSVLHSQTFLPEALPVFTFLELYVTSPGLTVGNLELQFYEGRILLTEIALMKKTE